MKWIWCTKEQQIWINYYHTRKLDHSRYNIKIGTKIIHFCRVICTYANEKHKKGPLCSSICPRSCSFLPSNHSELKLGGTVNQNQDIDDSRSFYLIPERPRTPTREWFLQAWEIQTCIRYAMQPAKTNNAHTSSCCLLFIHLSKINILPNKSLPSILPMLLIKLCNLKFHGFARKMTNGINTGKTQIWNT